MALAEVWKDRRVIAMTALGVVSGVLGTFSYELLERPYDMVDLWREASVGIIFGVIIGAYLFHIGLATPIRASAFAIQSLLSWIVAERFAIQFFARLPGNDFFGSWQWLITGVCAGLVGAAVLVLSILVLFPFFRRLGLSLVTILVGGAAGALLALADMMDSVLVLFPIWQAAFALCFALGFPKARSGENPAQ